MKKTAMQRFLPNEHNRRMFPGFVCFCVAAMGVALGFVAAALEVRALGIVAFVITAIGVAGGFLFIAYGWWCFFTNSNYGRSPKP